MACSIRLAWRPRDPLVIHVADRQGGAPQIYELPAAFVIHVANAFEEGESIIVDAILHPDPSLVESIRIPFVRSPSRDGPGLSPGSGSHRAGGWSASRWAIWAWSSRPIRPDHDGQPHRFTYAGALMDGVPTSTLL